MVRMLVIVSSCLVLAACGGKAKNEDTVGGGGDPCGGDPCAADPCAADPCAGDPCAADPCAADPCGADPCGGGAGAAAEVDFAGWDGWVKIHDTPMLSKGHGGKYVVVYVEASVEEAFRAKTGPYPEGARIVKAGYKDEAGTELENLTVMAKMGAGYDAENGDWYWGVFDASGSKAMKQGKLPMCINCHDQVSEQDYVFGK